jgi:uncharacterized membrane protein YbhN (UPF0104 family)
MKTNNHNKTKKLFRIAIWLLTIVLIGILYLYMRSRKEILYELLKIDFKDIILLIPIWILLSFTRSYTRRIMAASFGVKLKFLDWYGLYLFTNMLSLVIPARGDFIFSAAYLKKKYNLPISSFVSIIYGNSILLALTLSLEAMAILLYVGLKENVWNLKMWYIMGGMAALAIFFAFLPHKKLSGESWIAKKLNNMVESWKKLRSNTILLIKLVCLEVLGSLFFAFWMFFSYHVLDFDINFPNSFFAGIACQMSYFFKITPGNLGIRESLVGFVSQITNVGFAQGITVTLLQRALSTLGFLLLGGISGIFIIRKILSMGLNIKNMDAKNPEE